MRNKHSFIQTSFMFSYGFLWTLGPISLGHEGSLRQAHMRPQAALGPTRARKRNYQGGLKIMSHLEKRILW